MFRLIGIALAFLFIASGAAAQAKTEKTFPQVIYLVRHAEKEPDKGTGNRGPGLSRAGLERAGHLAYVLGDAGIEAIYSTDYARTLQTAQPLADRLGLTVQIYNPRELDQLVEKLRQSGARSLVVGHSNTTPRLVELLGGDGGAPIDDKSEFDRLYIVIGKGNGVITLLQRYGVPAARGQTR